MSASSPAVAGGGAAPAAEPYAFATIHASSVPVFSGGFPAAAVAAVLASRPFLEWSASLDARFSVRSITLQSVDFFGPRVGFSKIVCDATFSGQRVPGVVFLRGGAVSVLPLLTCGRDWWILCARQPRLAVGAHFLELPAGMIDDAGSFVGVAAKELKEETGIEIGIHELVDLTGLAYEGAPAPARGMYPSVGACDEFLRLFFFEREVDAEYLADLHGKLTGAADEDENITLCLVRYEDAWRATADSKVIASIGLLEKLVRTGRVTLRSGPLPE